MKIFLDMDGVLADFVGAACRVHNRTCYDKREHMGEFSLEKCWGISAAEFWAPTDSFDFWMNLDKTAEADMIVETAVDIVGWENVAILTIPSDLPECINAKKEWIKFYYPRLAKQMIFAYDKGFIADPGKLLVDDRDRNVEDWKAVGGDAILVPRPWNKYWQYWDTAYNVVERELANYA